MRAPRFALIAASLFLAACGGTSSWDPLASIPEPLNLPDGLDDRDPHVLYRYGQSVLEQSPARAAAAFYWASRLDPVWADPIYARRMALWMAEPRMFNAYLRRSRHAMNSPGVLRLDSLYLRALVLNPFLTRREDATALRYLIVYNVTGGMGHRVHNAELSYEVDSWMGRADPRTRGWYAQSQGRLVDAAQHYELAARQSGSAEVLADLARVSFLLGRRADARKHMTEAVDLLRSRDEDEDLVEIYNSKALLEHSLGMILEELGDNDEARQAYARALQEDLAFHPSHVRLAELALVQGDTTTALSEMAIAAETAPADAGVRLRYGRVLSAVGMHEEAAAEYREAIAAEPYFARPHFDLAVALEAAGKRGEAASEYRAFLEKAARSDRARAEAERRIGALQAAAASGSGTR